MQGNATLEPIVRPNYDAMLPGYGVWDRSNYADKRFLKGFRICPRWAELEPDRRGQYEWDIIDEAVKKADENDKYVYFQLLVGPDSPDWIYELEPDPVPLVKIKGKKEKKEKLKWPYYPHEKYQEYLTDTIRAIADHMFTGWSDNQLNRLLFIQVATGSTGDEAPYKGQAILEPGVEPGSKGDYSLDDKHPEWNDYRMTIFKAYAEEFQQPKRKKSIPLLFNKIDKEDYPDEYQWINDNVDYLGRKGSVLPRGYHLTEMREFIDKLRPYPLDPEKSFILTRAEMDQTWKHPYFQLNLPMNLYWGMLNALHGGLCVWDVSEDLLDRKKNDRLDEIIPTFKFFNKYAGGLFPESAKGAFIAFHKGLDSSDTEAYPVEEFGGANDDLNKKNTERYKAICKKYKKFGAKMDDRDGATLGQVQQRKEEGGLEGFNDCGWQIPRGNYERFITQIEPDETDVPRWRIDGPLKSDSPIQSRFARGFCAKENKNRIYLRVNEKFYSLKEDEEPTKIKVTVTYFYKGEVNFSLVYDSTEDSEKVAFKLNKKDKHKGKGEWRTKEVVLKDAAFKKRGPKSSDISLVNIGKEDDIFHMVEIEKMN